MTTVGRDRSLQEPFGRIGRERQPLLVRHPSEVTGAQGSEGAATSSRHNRGGSPIDDHRREGDAHPREARRRFDGLRDRHLLGGCQQGHGQSFAEHPGDGRRLAPDPPHPHQIGEHPWALQEGRDLSGGRPVHDHQVVQGPSEVARVRAALSGQLVQLAGDEEVPEAGGHRHELVQRAAPQDGSGHPVEAEIEVDVLPRRLMRRDRKDAQASPHLDLVLARIRHSERTGDLPPSFHLGQ